MIEISFRMMEISFRIIVAEALPKFKRGLYIQRLPIKS
jgi:hypothetical protein